MRPNKALAMPALKAVYETAIDQGCVIGRQTFV